MSDRTQISWTDATWSPVTGCTKVSEGCLNCYIERTPPFRMERRRFHLPVIGGTTGVRLHLDRLEQPLRWRKPRRIFVCSMADLFHEDVPDEYIAKVFAVMSQAPHHTFQVLTKRHARMRSLLRSDHFQSDAHSRAIDLVQNRTVEHAFTWPLPNVWLGVSVESQKWADWRIPALLDTPAAVRWLSCEPLLGPVDLTKWMPPTAPMRQADAPKAWADWTWPTWVPERVRTQVEDFWAEKFGRGPRAYLRDMVEQGAPAFGSVVTMRDGFRPDPPLTTGRFVHAWNNIGRIARDDGTFAYTSFSPRQVRRQRQLHWVVAGGESGPGARPMHPEWARSLRDQCVAASVPFHLKQWGEWGPAPWKVPVCDPAIGWTGTNEELAAAKADSEARGATHAYASWAHEYGHDLYQPPYKPWSLERDDVLDGGHAPMRRWGKKRAGRELDGVVWDQYPEVS